MKAITPGCRVACSLSDLVEKGVQGNLRYLESFRPGKSLVCALYFAQQFNTFLRTPHPLTHGRFMSRMRDLYAQPTALSLPAARELLHVLRFYSEEAPRQAELDWLQTLAASVALTPQLAIDSALSAELTRLFALHGLAAQPPPATGWATLLPRTAMENVAASGAALELADEGRLLRVTLPPGPQLLIRLIDDSPDQTDFARIQLDFLSQPRVRTLVLDRPPVLFLTRGAPTFQYAFEGESLRRLIATYALEKDTTTLRDGLVYTVEDGRSEFNFTSNVLLSFLRDLRPEAQPRCVFADALLQEALRLHMAGATTTDAQRVFEIARAFYFFENGAFFRAATRVGCHRCEGKLPGVRDVMTLLCAGEELRQDFRAPLVAAVTGQALARGGAYLVLRESAAAGVLERLVEAEAQRRLTGMRTFDFSRARYVESLASSAEGRSGEVTGAERIEVECMMETVLGLEMRHETEKDEEELAQLRERQLEEMSARIDFKSWLGAEEGRQLDLLRQQNCGAVEYLCGGRGPLEHKPREDEDMEQEAEAVREAMAKIKKPQQPQPVYSQKARVKLQLKKPPTTKGKK